MLHSTNILKNKVKLVESKLFNLFLSMVGRQAKLSYLLVSIKISLNKTNVGSVAAYNPRSSYLPLFTGYYKKRKQTGKMFLCHFGSFKTIMICV